MCVQDIRSFAHFLLSHIHPVRLLQILCNKLVIQLVIHQLSLWIVNIFTMIL